MSTQSTRGSTKSAHFSLKRKFLSSEVTKKVGCHTISQQTLSTTISTQYDQI